MDVATLPKPFNGALIAVLVGSARPRAELAGEVVVQAAIELIVARRRLAVYEKVVLSGERVGRHWRSASGQYCSRFLATVFEAGQRNLVVRRRATRVAVGANLQRIVESDGLPGTVAQVREVAVPPGVQRHGSDSCWCRCGRARSARELEERLVPAVVHVRNQDRTADGAAELVALQRRQRRTVAPVAPGSWPRSCCCARNSKRVKCRLLVPERVDTLITPPPVRPYSAASELVMIVNSSMLSTIG